MEKHEQPKQQQLSKFQFTFQNESKFEIEVAKCFAVTGSAVHVETVKIGWNAGDIFFLHMMRSDPFFCSQRTSNEFHLCK